MAVNEMQQQTSVSAVRPDSPFSFPKEKMPLDIFMEVKSIPQAR